jgi:hypothetical protein
MEVEKRIFGVRRVYGNCGANIAIYNDKNLDPLLGLPLKKSIQAPLG